MKVLISLIGTLVLAACAGAYVAGDVGAHRPADRVAQSESAAVRVR